jgi:hypothetical protein
MQEKACQKKEAPLFKAALHTRVSMKEWGYLKLFCKNSFQGIPYFAEHACCLYICRLAICVSLGL